MHEIEKWIEEAAHRQNIFVRKLTNEDARLVEQAARSRYIEGNPRVWWLGLKPGCESYASTSVELSALLPRENGSCWFLPETEDQCLPVYEVDVVQLPKLLNDCPLFEYNIVGRDFTWLIAESDHSVYFLCRGKVE